VDFLSNNFKEITEAEEVSPKSFIGDKKLNVYPAQNQNTLGSSIGAFHKQGDIKEGFSLNSRR